MAARLQLSLNEENQIHRDFVLSLDRPIFGPEGIPQAILNALRALIREPAVSDALAHASESQLKPTDVDSARYFFDAIDRIAGLEYLPSDEDILRARTSSQGNRPTTFAMGDVTYRLSNMSGQWHGWRKWIHHFEGMQAVLFLVDLGRYDDYEPGESPSVSKTSLGSLGV